MHGESYISLQLTVFSGVERCRGRVRAERRAMLRRNRFLGLKTNLKVDERIPVIPLVNCQKGRFLRNGYSIDPFPNHRKLMLRILPYLRGGPAVVAIKFSNLLELCVQGLDRLPFTHHLRAV